MSADLSTFACRPCPAGALCDPAQFPLPLATKGFWHALANPAQLYQCTEGACLPEGPDSNIYALNGSTNCRPGHRGPACAVCEPFFSRSGAFCQPCEPGAALATWSPARLGFFILGLLLFFFLASLAVLLSSLFLPLYHAWLEGRAAALGAPDAAAGGAAAAAGGSTFVERTLQRVALAMTQMQEATAGGSSGVGPLGLESGYWGSGFFAASAGSSSGGSGSAAATADDDPASSASGGSAVGPADLASRPAGRAAALRRRVARATVRLFRFGRVPVRQLVGADPLTPTLPSSPVISSCQLSKFRPFAPINPPVSQRTSRSSPRSRTPSSAWTGPPPTPASTTSSSSSVFSSSRALRLCRLAPQPACCRGELKRAPPRGRHSSS